MVLTMDYVDIEIGRRDIDNDNDNDNDRNERRNGGNKNGNKDENDTQPVIEEENLQYHTSTSRLL